MVTACSSCASSISMSPPWVCQVEVIDLALDGDFARQGIDMHGFGDRGNLQNEFGAHGQVNRTHRLDQHFAASAAHAEMKVGELPARILFQRLVGVQAQQIAAGLALRPPPAPLPQSASPAGIFRCPAGRCSPAPSRCHRAPRAAGSARPLPEAPGRPRAAASPPAFARAGSLLSYHLGLARSPACLSFTSCAPSTTEARRPGEEAGRLLADELVGIFLG